MAKIKFVANCRVRHTQRSFCSQAISNTNISHNIDELITVVFESYFCKQISVQHLFVQTTNWLHFQLILCLHTQIYSV